MVYSASLGSYSRLEAGKNGRFLRRKSAVSRNTAHTLPNTSGQRAVHVCIDNVRMDVAFTTDGLRISQSLCDGFDRRDDIALGLRRRFVWREFLQGAGGQHRTSPGSEILGGKFFTGDLSQIGI